MSIKIGSPAPEAVVDYWIKGAHGPRRMTLAEHRGKWVVLFFYPRDFTFICPTELVAFGTLEADFKAEEAVVIGASTDSFFSHKAWFESDPRLLGVSYPVLADTSQQLSKAFDVLLDDGASLRGTFIIDPQGLVRHITVNDLEVGRNVQETLRVLQALRSGELCPVAWKPGESTLTTYNEWVAQVFPRLSKAALADASNRMQTMRFQAGDVVIRQGDEPDRFYIIANGEVDVMRHTAEGADVHLATLGAGKFLARSDSLKKHGAPPMCGRIATSKCWRWTGETSRTCSTPQIPPLGISCISLSSEGPRYRHSVARFWFSGKETALSFESSCAAPL